MQHLHTFPIKVCVVVFIFKAELVLVLLPDYYIVDYYAYANIPSCAEVLGSESKVRDTFATEILFCYCNT